MAAASGNNDDADSSLLTWTDYQPHERPADSVENLRIGFVQVQQLLQQQRAATAEMNVLDNLPREICSHHPNLKRLKIYLAVVRSIPNCCFYSCENLQEVEFVLDGDDDDDDVRDIDGPSNSGDNNSHSAMQQSQLFSIRDRAFSYCRSLHTIVGLEKANASLIFIGLSSFNRCDSLSKGDFLTSLTSIEGIQAHSFSCCALLTNVDLSKATNLQHLERQTFCYCTSLQRVALPPNLQTIGIYTFSNCLALAEIRLPPALQRIAKRAFHSCKALATISIPPLVSPRISYAFHCCTSLTTVTFQSLQHFCRLMGSNPFQHCGALHTIELPGHIPRKLWPLILNQLLEQDPQRGILMRAGIMNPKQQATIVWNFLRSRITNFFLEETGQQH